MTATAQPRNTSGAGLIPAKGTYGMAANIILLRGTIVTIDADGRADVPTAGQNAAGVSSSTFDNRTTAPEGGGADAVKAEVEFGVKGLLYTGTAPEPGQVVYVVDNQTVSIDSSSGTRGIAGYCTELRDGLCWTWMGPHVVAQIVIAASEASQLDTAQTDIDALEADVVSTENQFVLPLGAARLSTGAAVPAFADGSADGFELTASEALSIRWNDDGTSVIVLSGVLPSDLDPTEDLIFHFAGATIGGADPTTALTVGLFFHPTAAAYSADADAGGDTTAFDGATTVVTDETLTVAAADVPAASTAFTMTITPNANLDADDFALLAVYAQYTGVALT